MLCVLMSVAVLVNCSGSVCWVCIPKNSSWSNVPYLLPRAHVQGVKQSVLSVCLFVSQHKNCEIWRSRHHSKMQVSLQCREGVKTYLLLPSRRLKRATSAINHVFLSATPFNHPQLSYAMCCSIVHALTQVGKCRHFINWSMSPCRWWIILL